MSTVIVIGAGPAGIMASLGAAKAGHRVLLLEKNSLPGRKLSITGGGRCNITNSTDIDGFISNTISNGKFLYGPFFTFSNEDMIELLKSCGVAVHTEDNGRVFPASGSSRDIIDALLRLIKIHGVKLKTKTAVQSLVLEKTKNHGDICTGVKTVSGEVIKSDITIVTTGGITYPSTGSTGDGYEFARKSGHGIIEPCPALAPFVTKDSSIKDLQGISLKNIHGIVKQDGKILFKSTGDILFTHYGISGPLILNASGYCESHLKNGELTLVLDFLHEEKNMEERMLSLFNTCKNKQIRTALKTLFPESIAVFLLAKAEISQEKPVHSISKKEAKPFPTD